MIKKYIEFQNDMRARCEEILDPNFIVHNYSINLDHENVGIEYKDAPFKNSTMIKQISFDAFFNDRFDDYDFPEDE